MKLQPDRTIKKMKYFHSASPSSTMIQRYSLLLLVLTVHFLGSFYCEAFVQVSSTTRSSSSSTFPSDGGRTWKLGPSADGCSSGLFGRPLTSRLHYLSPDHNDDSMYIAEQESVWFQNAIQTSIETSSEEALTELIGDWQLNDNDSDDDDDQKMKKNNDQDSPLLVFLFLSHHWNLENVTSHAMDLLEEKLGETKKENINLITVVGGGVIGQNEEYEEETIHPVYGNKVTKKQMSILGGYCNTKGRDEEDDTSESSSSSPLQVFSISNDDAATGKTTNRETNPRFQPDSSLFVFSDPYCRQVQNLFQELHAIHCQVAGGISVPPKSALHDPTLALNRKILHKGSLVGVQLPSNYQLQCVVSQGGCRPVGPTFRVTSVDGPAIHELNEVKALEQLDRLCGGGKNNNNADGQGEEEEDDTKINEVLSAGDQELIRQGGILAGVFLEASSPTEGDEKNQEEDEVMSFPSSTTASDESVGGKEDVGLEGEYMVREVTGFRPRSGSILVCGQPQVQQGDLFRFHVRSSQEALDDWKLLLEQTKMEQLFLISDRDAGVDTISSGVGGGDPKTTSRIVCGMQISSLARGKDFFDTPNVDLDHAKMLLQSKKQDNHITPPIGGFFSNAEIGPVGIRMGAESDSSQPYLHGFATVVAMLCEITPTAHHRGEEEDSSQETISWSQSSWD